MFKEIIEKLKISEDTKKTIIDNIEKLDIIYLEDLGDYLVDNFKELANKGIISKEDLETNLQILAMVLNKSVLEIEKRYKWLKEMNLDRIYNIHKNHLELFTIFDDFNKMLNENQIEYYYTSGVLAYILVGKELERLHHDIDVFIRFSDLEKLEKIGPKYNFRFRRLLGERGDGTQRRVLKMYYKDYDIPITLFMYNKEIDDSITQYDFFYGKGELLVEEIYNSRECARLSFSDTKHFHNNIMYKAITLEALYLCKDKGRPKDRYDCEIIKPFVDFAKLEKLKKATLENKPNEVHKVNNLEIRKFINGEEVLTLKREKC